MDNEFAFILAHPILVTPLMQWSNTHHAQLLFLPNHTDYKLSNNGTRLLCKETSMNAKFIPEIWSHAVDCMAIVVQFLGTWCCYNTLLIAKAVVIIFVGNKKNN